MIKAYLICHFTIAAILFVMTLCERCIGSRRWNKMFLIPGYGRPFEVNSMSPYMPQRVLLTAIMPIYPLRLIWFLWMRLKDSK